MPEADQEEMTSYVREICPRCGNLRIECSDEDRSWYPQRSVCYATAARELTMRRFEKKHGDADTLDELHPADGVEVWMSSSDLTPDDHFV